MPKRPTQNQLKAVLRDVFNDGAWAMVELQQRAAVDKFRNEAVNAHFAHLKRLLEQTNGEL